jgi:hypothetical protein
MNFMSEILDAVVPVVAVVMIFGTGMLALFLNYLKRKQLFALYHQERMAAIEKGIELPPLPEDFFREDSPPPRRQSQRPRHGTLLGGLILFFVGITLYLAIHFTVSRMEDGADPAMFALIPAGVGAACVIYYVTVGRKLGAVLEEERNFTPTTAKPTGTPANTPTLE